MLNDQYSFLAPIGNNSDSEHLYRSAADIFQVFS